MAKGPISHISSPAERARRYRALREAMAGAGIDALVIYCRGDDFMRGRVQYVSDIWQAAGWGIVVLPAKGEPSYIGDPLWGGKRMATMVNWIQDARHTQTPEVEIAGILSDHGYSNGTIGMAGLADITTYALMSGLGKLAPGATLVDATDLFDDVRIKKSPEEIENHRETSRILEQVFRSLEAHIRPGALDIDVMAEAHRLVRQYGCLTGIAQTGRTSPRALTEGRHAPYERGEYLSIDLEWQGPSGYWLELRRNYCFGKPSDEAKRFWEIRCEVFQACIDAMKSGDSSDDVLAARDRVNDKYGLGGRELVSYSAHGLGTDSLEPPWSPGKERIMETDMIINLHPHSTFSDPAAYQSVSALSLADNIRVTPTGGERLTYAEDVLVNLDD